MTTMTAALEGHTLKSFISENPVAKLLFSHILSKKIFLTHNSD